MDNRRGSPLSCCGSGWVYAPELVVLEAMSDLACATLPVAFSKDAGSFSRRYFRRLLSTAAASKASL